MVFGQSKQKLVMEFFEKYKTSYFVAPFLPEIFKPKIFLTFTMQTFYANHYRNIMNIITPISCKK